MTKINLRDKLDPQQYVIPNKHIADLTEEEFRNIPFRENWNSTTEKFDNLVILPMQSKHDSGYRLMDFVACKSNKPICRLSGCSDVFHLNGIGGYGNFNGSIPVSTPVIAWSIDCLPKSGLLRLWCNFKLLAGPALSSFELFIT